MNEVKWKLENDYPEKDGQYLGWMKGNMGMPDLFDVVNFEDGGFWTSLPIHTLIKWTELPKQPTE